MVNKIFNELNKNIANKILKKLCVDDVIEIRKLHNDGMNYSEIARKYNVTPQCINDICNYKRWKQVP